MNQPRTLFLKGNYLSMKLMTRNFAVRVKILDVNSNI